MNVTSAAEPRFNSIVELLASANPATLDRLRNSHPDYATLLRPGMVMGGAGPATDRRKLYCDLCREGIQAAETQLAALLQNLPVQLARAKKLRLAAAVVSSIASAGVLTAVFANAALEARVAAAIAFLATLGTLLAQYFETPIVGAKPSIGEYLHELIGLEKRLQDARLQMLDADGDLPKANPGQRRFVTCRDIIPTVNDIAARIRAIQLFAGVAYHRR
jgi:hypothetical protein